MRTALPAEMGVLGIWWFVIEMAECFASVPIEACLWQDCVRERQQPDGCWNNFREAVYNAPRVSAMRNLVRAGRFSCWSGRHTLMRTPVNFFCARFPAASFDALGFQISSFPVVFTVVPGHARLPRMICAERCCAVLPLEGR